MPLNPSELQSETSRENGAKSNGPVTPEGKANSSKSAITHGYFAKSTVIPGEHQEEFDKHCEEIFATFVWRNGVEKLQIQKYCDWSWKVQRLEILHSEAMKEDPVGKKARRLFKYLSAMQRFTDTALRECKATIKLRMIMDVQQIEVAVIIRRADLAMGRETDLKGLGFLVNIRDVDDFIATQDRHDRSLIELGRAKAQY